MLRHATMGYTVHLQRLLGYVGWPLLYIFYDKYSEHSEEGEEIRKIIFDGCACRAMLPACANAFPPHLYRHFPVCMLR